MQQQAGVGSSMCRATSSLMCLHVRVCVHRLTPIVTRLAKCVTCTPVPSTTDSKLCTNAEVANELLVALLHTLAMASPELFGGKRQKLFCFCAAERCGRQLTATTYHLGNRVHNKPLFDKNWVSHSFTQTLTHTHSHTPSHTHAYLHTHTSAVHMCESLWCAESAWAAAVWHTIAWVQCN